MSNPSIYRLLRSTGLDVAEEGWPVKEWYVTVGFVKLVGPYRVKNDLLKFCDSTLTVSLLDKLKQAYNAYEWAINHSEKDIPEATLKVVSTFKELQARPGCGSLAIKF